MGIATNISSNIASNVSFNTAGIPQGTGFAPLVNLVNPSPQSVSPAGLVFDTWTIYIKFEDQGTPASNSFLWLLRLDANNFAQFRYLNNGVLRMDVTSGGVNQVFTETDSNFLSGSGDGRITVSAQQNNTVLYINGVLAENITSINMPVGTPSSLAIGQNAAGAEQWPNAIREFQYYNQRLPDTLVQGLGG